MIPNAVGSAILETDARLPIVVVAHHEGIETSDDESHKEDLPLEALGGIGFPTGIEDGGKEEEKQHLADVRMWRMTVFINAKISKKLRYRE